MDPVDPPYLPKIDEVGLGFDIVTGEAQQRVVHLDYDNPKPFAHPIMGNFLIPGNIECYSINKQNE
jgi:hypothetical protein